MTIKARVLTRFPSRVVAGTGLDLTKTNGVYTFAVDVAELLALVLAEIPASTHAAFYAHKAGTDQTGLTSANYSGTTWPATYFNMGSYFDTTNSWWTPPEGTIHVDASIFQSAHASTTGTVVLKVLRFHSGISITNASPGVITWTNHLLTAGQPVQFTATGGLPTGLVSLTVYYVKTVLTANTFTVAATRGGVAINTSSAGSGTFNGFCDFAASEMVGAVAGIVGVDVSADGITNGTDHIIVNYFQTDDGGGTGTLDGNPAHTRFSGHWIGPSTS